MEKKQKIDEKYLLDHFSKIQEFIAEWEKKYSLPADLLPPIESEDQKPFITQPFYTHQIHAVS